MLQTAITDHAKSGFGLAPNKKPNGTASRSSRPEVFCKQGVLKNCKNSWERKHLCWSLFLIKPQALKPVTLLKRDSSTVA